MKFKNTTCLKKVWVNKAETLMTETEIIFNESKLRLEGNKLFAEIKEREVLFLANSTKELKEESLGKKPLYNIAINRLDCYSNESIEIELIDEPINLLIITKSIYDVMKSKFITDEAVYEEIYKLGITQVSTDLVEVKDFCAITCNIV